ncbi:N(G),N(G)-dimethylarginine dimethylaminohydrolase [Jatrophihabitans telluris]|uniref:N(G),N(G)-dimethylarginine dimethylaminohydrolase n=1 Tax=Jatrophihabitans telluris TaxID=2038343 RepID=A0ABY4R2D9_9ACTN|nr:dimethylargininase [Jatrophihabitans telluris]UQX89326.1 N(G),N(G)-dimethylarginine dimethylaminohydrolase [Jatrophihabitans telluris]
MTVQQRALVRRPSPQLADGITTHIDRSPVDVDLAVKQWQNYVGALSDAGWDIVEVAPADDCPDGVFVEDSVVMFGALAVLTSPGAASRRAEIAGTAEAITGLGYRSVTIAEPGTLDGGDVLKVGRQVYVGRGGRTNAEGVRQFRAALAPLGARVTAVPLTKALHLKSAVTALPDGTVIGFSPVVDDPGFFPLYRAMPEEPGAHVVDLGSGHLLMSAAAPESAALIEDLGYQPVPVDISEYEKLEGCVTCLSVRLRSAP